MPFYVDTSAAAKLVLAERGTAAFMRWVARTDEPLYSSDLLRTELLRTVRKQAPTAMAAARAMLERLTLLTLSRDVFERAALLEPIGLRSLDALHLAAAQELGDDLSGIVTYDDRMIDASNGLGLRAVSPR